MLDRAKLPAVHVIGVFESDVVEEGIFLRLIIHPVLLADT